MEKTEFSLKTVREIKKVFEESGLYDPDLDGDTAKQPWINDVYDIMSDCTLDERHFLMITPAKYEETPCARPALQVRVKK